VPHQVIITRDFDHMSEVAAGLIRDRIARALRARDDFVLGLATGSSPTGVYKHLAKAVNGGSLDATRIRSFNLDEYVGLPRQDPQARALHPQSYSFFMVQELFGLLRTKFAETSLPRGCLVDQDLLVRELEANPGDWEEQGADRGKAIVIRREAKSAYLRWVLEEVLDAYERKIERSGGIDLHLVGVGGRGHVAFHESGIPFEGNRMLLVELDDDTVANAVADGHFACREESPRYAVSMGAELVYRAGCVVLLACGRRKAAPVAASLAEDPSPAVPISYGQVYAQRGGELLYVIDRAAASGVLARRDEIERRGILIEDLSDRGAECRVEDLKFSRNPSSGLLE
jgi:glucosamine-6-phosphate deaminase